MDLQVIDIIGSAVALSPEPGHNLYKAIRDQIKRDQKVKLDFRDIQVISTAFLNSAIGRLYSDFSSEQLNSYLSITNLPDEDILLLQKVIKRAKEYFENKDSFDKKIEDRYDQ
jgi:hypothetical protein